MLKKLAAAAGLLLVPALAAMRLQAPEQALTVSTARFFSPATGSTTIEGVVEVNLAAVFAAARQAARYRFEVHVADSTGLELLRNEWTRDIPAGARGRGATAMESFSFAAAPGRYRIKVRAAPEGGEALEREAEVVAFARRPAVSDLVLATFVRAAASDSETLAPGEIRRSGMAMRTAPLPHLTPTSSTVAYYAEFYTAGSGPLTGELRARVTGAGGRLIVETPARPVQVDSGGGMARGTLDMTGLPEGVYQLRLVVRLGDSTFTADAPFAMAGLTTLADARPGRTGAVDPFEAGTEAQLDSLYAPLVYLITARGEQGVYGTLTVEGKRRFLREFWRRRDPTPGDAENANMTQFYRAVAFVNEAFRESGTAHIPGWRTDRGRVYLRNGVWDEQHTRPTASPRPYEVWKYTRDRARYYVFMDQSGLGHYVLLGTNDRREGGRPDWLTYLGAESADDVRRFLNLGADPNDR